MCRCEIEKPSNSGKASGTTFALKELVASCNSDITFFLSLPRLLIIADTFATTNFGPAVFTT